MWQYYTCMLSPQINHRPLGSRTYHNLHPFWARRQCLFIWASVNSLPSPDQATSLALCWSSCSQQMALPLTQFFKMKSGDQVLIPDFSLAWRLIHQYHLLLSSSSVHHYPCPSHPHLLLRQWHLPLYLYSCPLQPLFYVGQKDLFKTQMRLT